MRGLVFELLGEVVSSAHGEARWDEILTTAGLEGGYTALAWYPDEEFDHVLEVSADALGMKREDLLRWFGRRAVPFGAHRYPWVFASHTSSTPFILSLTELIPEPVRHRYPEAQFPLDDVEMRPNGDGLTVDYRSERSLCMFVQGLIEGVGDYYGEQASVVQAMCELNDDDFCRLDCTFTKREASPARPSLPSNAEPGPKPDPSLLERRLARERSARRRAEAIAAKALRRVYGIVEELERSNEELREREARFSAGVGASPDAVVSADEEGRIWYFNKAAERMFGYERDELVGEPLTLLMPDRYHGDHMQGFARFLATGEPKLIGKTVELAGKHKAGNEFPVEVSYSTWTSKKGRFFVGVLRDVSERKRMEKELLRQAEELARSNAELEMFASAASHDLKEPLRMIGSYVELLAERYRGALDEEADEFIGYALDGVRRMRRLIDDLLRLSRVGTHGRPFEPTDSGKALNQALTNLQVARLESRAAVTHGPMPVLPADPIQLVQLFQNLIANAIKFRDHTTPQVHVSVGRSGDEWLFSVRDNGIGIEAEYLDRIFVPFQRLHTRDEYPGSGIGLTLCKKIVDRHGGRIWVKSEPAQGTTFYFTIPAKGNLDD